jgi:tRNA pseudouridine38-40 synthase
MSSSPTKTWHLSVAYDGSAYHGWQIQPSIMTIQGEIQSRLRLLFKDDTLLVSGTSRTDAGVHALDQQVSFTTSNTSIPERAILQALNSWLDKDIRITQVREQAPGFSARFDACGKTYVYGMHLGQTCSPFANRYLWHYSRRLNLETMSQAAELLVGTHDFASFGVNPHRELESTVRTLHRLELKQVGEQLFFCISGNSFLYKMVRSLVGYLVHVGTSRNWSPGDTLAVLAARDRSAAATTAPARGLFLAKVFFAEDQWQDYEPPLPPYC